MLDQTELWEHLHAQYGLFLPQDEMDSIVHIVIQQLRKEHPKYFPATTSLLTAPAAKETNGKHPKPNAYAELLVKHATKMAKHVTKMAGPGTVNIRDSGGLFPHIRPDGQGGYEVNYVAIFVAVEKHKNYLTRQAAAQITKK
jgi:hypothetical protein